MDERADDQIRELCAKILATRDEAGVRVTKRDRNLLVRVLPKDFQTSGKIAGRAVLTLPKSYSLFAQSSEARQGRQDQIQVRDQGIEDAAEIASVQQVGDVAEQVAEQISCSRYGRDVQDYLIQVNGESQQIQVQRTEHQIQDGTGCRYTRDRQRHQLIGDLCDCSGRAGYSAIQNALRDQLISLAGKVGDRENSVKNVTGSITDGRPHSGCMRSNWYATPPSPGSSPGTNVCRAN